MAKNRATMKQFTINKEVQMFHINVYSLVKLSSFCKNRRFNLLLAYFFAKQVKQVALLLITLNIKKSNKLIKKQYFVYVGLPCKYII